MAEEGTKKPTKPFTKWVIYAIALVLAAGGVGLVSMFYTSVGGSMKDTAFAQGKQARIVLESRTVEGNLADVTPPPAQQEEKPAEQAPGEHSDEEALPPDETTPEEQPQEQTQEQGAVTQEPETLGSEEEVAQAEAADASAPSPEESLPPPNVKTPLNGALDSSLSETVKGVGSLPKISDSGMESWRYYGKPDMSDKSKPVVAIVVTGLGLNHKTTGKALLLPEEVSLSFSPYARQLQQQMTRARAYGHEVWLDLPLEPENYPATDAGPLTLFHEMKEEERAARFHSLLATATTYTGLVGTASEIFSDYAPMHDIAKEIKSRGILLLLRAKRYENSETADHVFYINRTLDALAEGNGPTSAQLLVELEASAKEYGYAIGALSDAPQVFTQLSEWTGTLEGKGLQLVPVTAITSRLKK